MENMKAGNTKLEKELEDIYILIGSTPDCEIKNIPESVWDRASELYGILYPPMTLTPLPTNCDCGRRDCWECVYKDDPMGI